MKEFFTTFSLRKGEEKCVWCDEDDEKKTHNKKEEIRK